MSAQKKIRIPSFIVIKRPTKIKERFLELPVPNPIPALPPKTSSLENREEVVIDINQDDLDTFIV